MSEPHGSAAPFSPEAHSGGVPAPAPSQPYQPESTLVSSNANISSTPPPGPPIPPPRPSVDRHVLADRYEILALIGAGGMGTVYRARDLELDEDVALKVLRPELAVTPEVVDRFRREARLARRVTHPNVARVFDIGEHHGERFLSMELVDGESLSASIARKGAFPLQRALDVAKGVAAGLSGAHAAGVIHRDLKPDNVLIARSGRVVITDFGVARGVLDAAQAGADSSAVGMLLGTPAYMAPEQVRGSPDVNELADIYAFGALLFEIVTGHRAWPGDSPFGVAAARLISPPPDPRARRPDLPEPWAELALWCMAREPEERPASIAEVVDALEMLPTAGSEGVPAPPPSLTGARPSRSTGTTGPRAPFSKPAHAEKTVAVLPFSNGGVPEDQYLAEELTDDLVDALSMTRGLRVRARGAVLRMRAADRDPCEVGRELGVQVVVGGTVRRGGGRVRISARLISVVDGFQIWAKRFDRPEQDVLSINDEAARAIADALTLDGQALEEHARDAPSNPVALDLYIRARHAFRQFQQEQVKRSIDLFEQALALAPGDPLVLAGLSRSLSRMTYYTADKEGLARAREVAELAVTAAPQLGEAHHARGVALFFGGDLPNAARALRTAVTRSPGHSDAHVVLGHILFEAGAGKEAVHHYDAALSHDPSLSFALCKLAEVQALLGRWDEADGILKAVEKTSTVGYWTAARVALWRRQGDLVVHHLSNKSAPERTAPQERLLLESVITRRLAPELRDVDALTRDAAGARRHVFLFQLRAEIAGYLDDREEVIASLRAGVDLGLVELLWLERCPLLDDARQDGRFAAIHAEAKQRADEILAAYRSP